MPFTNPITFDFVAPEVENVDYYLWRGVSNVPSQRSVTLPGTASYSQLRDVPCFGYSSASTIPFGFCGGVGNKTTLPTAWSFEFDVFDSSNAFSNSFLENGIGAHYFLVTNTGNFTDWQIQAFANGVSFLNTVVTRQGNLFDNVKFKYTTATGLCELFYNDVSLASTTSFITLGSADSLQLRSQVNVVNLKHANIRYQFYYA